MMEGDIMFRIGSTLFIAMVYFAGANVMAQSTGKPPDPPITHIIMLKASTLPSGQMAYEMVSHKIKSPDRQERDVTGRYATGPTIPGPTLVMKEKVKDINIAEEYDPISGEHKGEAYGLGPIQTPVSPDGKYVVTANFLSSTITILDTKTDKVVKSLPCEPGCHGVNFGLKKGGGYSAYVASKFANDLLVVDMDKLDIVGRILLVDPKDGQITANYGMGGQGVLPHLSPTLACSPPPSSSRARASSFPRSRAGSSS
jgi:YVTN family beta-propeller protein